jgi:sugar O-acyltransferase (sialic acid O-acetyltransferase NeuD family)
VPASLRDLVIVGAGGHGRELLDIIEAINSVEATFRFLGFIDDGSPDLERLARRNASHLGTLDTIGTYGAEYVVGIGDGEARRQVVSVADAAGCEAATLIHPAASCGGDVVLGPGVVLAAGARVTTNVRLGAHTHLNINSVVSHDCAVDAFVTLSPGALVNGSVRIGEGAFLGTAAVITPGRSVGSWSKVGAGAVVVDDVRSGATVVGVPARETATP